MSHQPGHLRRLGPFVLKCRLDETPHSRVWWATAPDGRAVVVKELKVRNPGAEPYRRFRDEVGFHLRGPYAGVLEVIDASVPEHPGKDSPAWLAMLPAHVCRDALTAGDFEQVVGAFAAYAAALARLAVDGIFHRDLKPNNLFERDGEWLVGDFGLVTFPEKSEVTASGQKLGPANFVAPEMVDDPASARPGPADVWALTKTFWTLAVGKAWPMPGQLRVDDDQTMLSARVSHPRAVHLERMVELATSLDPMRRPSMQDLADELAAWDAQQDDSSPSQVDLDRLATQVSAFSESTVRARDAQKRERAASHETFGHLLTAWEQLGPEMARFGQPFEEDSGLLFHLGVGSGRRDQTLVASVARHVATAGFPNIGLSAEVGFEAFDGPLIRMAAMFYVRANHRNPEVIWSGVREGIPGSASGALAAAQLGRQFAEHFGESAQAFTGLVADAAAARQASRQQVMYADGETYQFRTEPQGGLITILRRSDGSRDGTAIAWHGVPIDEIRADGDRLWLKSGGREGFVERTAPGQWVLASERLPASDADPS